MSAKNKPAIQHPELQAIPVIADRLTFLYLEHCTVNRADNAVTATDQRGTVHVPAAALSTLLLGPGTSVTHRAMELLGTMGVSVLWIGEHGVRFYAHGQPLTHSATLLLRQARLVTNVRSRVAVARKMYQMRFADEDVSSLTMQQLRGREGARMRSVYKKASKEWKVPWSGREYKPDDFSASDPVNAALSVGHACLYGLAHSVIMALGCSPGLGFVHEGHDRSFVYDVADLYKSEVTIPLAFRVASMDPEDLPGTMRRMTRDAMASVKLLERMVHDIRALLLTEDELEAEALEANVLYLWDDQLERVANAVSYGKELDIPDAGGANRQPTPLEASVPLDGSRLPHQTEEEPS